VEDRLKAQRNPETGADRTAGAQCRPAREHAQRRCDEEKRTARCAHVEEGECVGRGRVDRPLTSLEGIRGAASFTRSDPSLTCETQSPFYGDEFLHLKAEPLHG